MNTPVISTVVGQTEEVLKDGENGYLIEQDERMEENFISKALDLIRNKSLYCSLLMSSQKNNLNEFSQENMSKQYEQVFYELLENRSK